MEENKESFTEKGKIISKWKKIKISLEIKNSLESSLKFMKKKTLEQFMANYCEIYKYKIALYLFSKKTNKILLNKDYFPEDYNNIEICDDSKELCYDSYLKDFLFYFRENNVELVKIIDLLPKDEKNDFAFFLCQLFYGNFINTKSRQDELLLLIYLLLEKEINELKSPMEDRFLNESFMDYFFRAFLHREEVKNYLNIVLISEIENINRACFGYNSMDMVLISRTHYKDFMDNKHNYSFYDMEKQIFYVNETFHSKIVNNQASYSDNFLIVEKDLEDKIMNDKVSLNTVRKINYENININSILLPEFFNEINHDYIKKLLHKEKDQFMRSFYMNQLKFNKNDSFIFNCRDFYYERMVKEKIISRIAIENYNKEYKLIIKFLNNVLKNLENKNIIPFSIKIICKLIYILFKKKFPKITEFQLFILIGRFLFDKIINPIFENVELSCLYEKEIISFDTRKTLVDIYFVFRKLIKGELFTSKQYENYKIFNQFILDNFSRVKNIFQNLIDVTIPQKILSLIDNSIKEKKPTNNNKTSASKNVIDFNSQKCICFTVYHLLLFYNIVNNNKNIFIKEGTELEKIFNELSKYIPQMEINNNKFYIITKEEFEIEIKPSFVKEKTKLPKKEEILNKLKLQIMKLLSDIQIKNNWNYLVFLDTKQTFEYINRYLLEIEKKKRLIPLNWYSKYILENLNLIEEKYKRNDYQLLYEEIEFDILKLITKLKNLNGFLSVHINKRFLVLENKKQRLKSQYEKIKLIILKLKTILFIEKAEIDLCFIDGKKYNELQKTINKKNESNVNYDTPIIKEINNCLHSKIKDEKYLYLINEEELNQYHVHKVKEFIYKLSSYSKLISEEIMHYVINQRAESKNKNSIASINKGELNNIISFIISSKDAIINFMKYLETIMLSSPILKPFQSKEEKEQASKYILDYIAKSLSYSIYQEKPLSIDTNFYQKCCILSSFVKPSHFKLSDELEDKNILRDIIYHFVKVEELKIPNDILEEFEKAINLISSLFNLFFGQEKNGIDNKLNMVIYCIILTKPKRLIFNTYFCKFFLMNEDINGNFSFHISQIEKAINIISKIDAQFLNLSDEEFNEKCLKYKFIK